ncbi:hypothetical protein SCHPADRAFT_90420 [Schizopora paradoxa]|uniref:Uncharacterized protein n=1 Tax=Schizopora paradoxa TaxID=27342 RepID=A0A0H2S4C2_9AGAM|nr:hypothetical protein SCHPADRAFT_90420 [Schizopora paradoxa]
MAQPLIDGLEQKLGEFFDAQWCTSSFHHLLDFDLADLEVALANQCALPDRPNHARKVRPSIANSTELRDHLFTVATSLFGEKLSLLSPAQASELLDHEHLYLQTRVYSLELLFRDALLRHCQNRLSKLTIQDRRDWMRQFSNIIEEDLSTLALQRNQHERLYRSNGIHYPASLLMLSLCDDARLCWRNFVHYNFRLTLQNIRVYFAYRIRFLSDPVVRRRLSQAD